MTPVRLLLVGAGHAHLEILRRLAGRRPAKLEVTLVSLGRRHFYSGMVPGFLAGTYAVEEIAFDLPPLAEGAGARFVVGKATALDPAGRSVTLEDGRWFPYDVVSFNIGSLIGGATHEEVSREAVLVKPFGRVMTLAERMRELAEHPDDAVRHAVVVGGGAAGVEIACALAAVLDRHGARRALTLVDVADEILPGYSERFRRLAREVLAARGIEVRTGERATAVGGEGLELASGGRLPSQLTVWLAGPAAAPIFQESGLPTDARGFLLVDDALRSPGSERVFAAGDCATLERYPETPKAGVYAVRQAPVLWQSLMASVEGGSHPCYRPQRGFLSLLNTADGKALLRYKGLVSHSRWAWRLKDAIDRRFMRRYQGRR